MQCDTVTLITIKGIISNSLIYLLIANFGFCEFASFVYLKIRNCVLGFSAFVVRVTNSGQSHCKKVSEHLHCYSLL